MDLRPQLTVRLFREEKCFGPGIAVLMEQIEKTHSLRGAAKEMDMAYSKAWKILKNAEEQLGFPLTQTASGGKVGGTVLTEKGKDLLSRYRSYVRELNGFAEKTFSRDFREYLSKTT